MKFGREKCAMLVMKSGKRHLTDGMDLPNQDKIRMLGEKGTYKYLCILEADTTKQVEMKEKIQKEYLRKTRKLLETKLSGRNLIKEINTWAIPLIIYSGNFLMVIHWEMCKNLKFNHTNKWYLHNQASVQKNDTHKLL